MTRSPVALCKTAPQGEAGSWVCQQSRTDGPGRPELHPHVPGGKGAQHALPQLSQGNRDTQVSKAAAGTSFSPLHCRASPSTEMQVKVVELSGDVWPWHPGTAWA